MTAIGNEEEGEMNLKGDIEYIDCGEVIWMTKKHWETLKRWFAQNGLELEEYKRRETLHVKAKARRK
jgi:aspartate/tyrosine/aromatic aminotransferase